MKAVTALEQDVLDAIRSVSDWGWYSDEIASFAAQVTKPQLGGVIASLVKKGLVTVEQVDGREYVELVADAKGAK